MPIDPFAVLNAMLRAEAARSTEPEDRHRAGEPDDDTRETAPDDGPA
ncbi:hypothetical protein ACIHCQ_26095 [Streptomyces sp. NPDC052236]